MNQSSLIHKMYLRLLSHCMMRLRHQVKNIDQDSYILLDAIHNIPGLLLGNDIIDHQRIINELKLYEGRYCNGDDRYTQYLNGYQSLIDIDTSVVIDSTTHKACAYIIDPEGRYLLQRRSSHMCDGSSNMLTLFGGGMDAGETVMQGLVRELQEELELDITLCDVRYIGCHVSSTGVRFEIFEVQMNYPQHFVLHEGDEIVMIAKEQLYDPEITSWFQKINQIYLGNMMG